MLRLRGSDRTAACPAPWRRVRPAIGGHDDRERDDQQARPPAVAPPHLECLHEIHGRFFGLMTTEVADRAPYPPGEVASRLRGFPAGYPRLPRSWRQRTSEPRSWRASTRARTKSRSQSRLRYRSTSGLTVSALQASIPAARRAAPRCVPGDRPPRPDRRRKDRTPSKAAGLVEPIERRSSR